MGSQCLLSLCDRLPQVGLLADAGDVGSRKMHCRPSKRIMCGLRPWGAAATNDEERRQCVQRAA